MIRFVILATPRTGSNWLCSLLDSHPEILCHHEIFNPEGIHMALSKQGSDLGFGSIEERDRDPLRLLERVWRQDFGHRALGFKINRGQSAAALGRVLEDGNVRKIVIRRANRIRTYVSERIAEASGEWESTRGLKIGRARTTVRIDPEELRQHSQLNQRHYEEIHQALDASGQSAFEVRYEDLSAPQVRRGLLGFLQVSPEVGLRPATRKQNPAALSALIANFGELEVAFRGSDLEQDLYAEDMLIPKGDRGF